MDSSVEYLSSHEICLLEVNVNTSNLFQRFIIKKTEYVNYHS